MNFRKRPYEALKNLKICFNKMLIYLFQNLENIPFVSSCLFSINSGASERTASNPPLNIHTFPMPYFVSILAKALALSELSPTIIMRCWGPALEARWERNDFGGSSLGMSSDSSSTTASSWTDCSMLPSLKASLDLTSMNMAESRCS